MHNENPNGVGVLEKFCQHALWVQSKVNAYAIPGKLDSLDDVSSDVMLLIHKLMNRYPGIDADSPLFVALLRRSVHNMLISRVRYHNADRRNASLEISGDQQVSDKGDILFDIATPDVPGDWWWLDMGVNPLVACELADLKATVRRKLSEDSKLVWDLLTNPTEELRQRNLLSRRKAISFFTLRIYLSEAPTFWSYHRTLGCLDEVREVVVEVFGKERVERTLRTPLYRSATGAPTVTPTRPGRWSCLVKEADLWVNGTEISGTYQISMLSRDVGLFLKFSGPVSWEDEVTMVSVEACVAYTVTEDKYVWWACDR
jgi:hypothetical protein